MANAETIYQAKAASPLVNPTAATMFLKADGSSMPTTVAAVYIPDIQQNQANTLITAPAGAKQYRVRFMGRVVPGTSGTLALVLYVGNSATAASNTAFFSPTAATYATNGHFSFEVLVNYDVTSGKLDGIASGAQGSTYAAVAPAAASTISVTEINQKVALSISAVFGTSNASNIVYLDDFFLEQI